MSKGETLSLLLPQLGIELEEMLAIGEGCCLSSISAETSRHAMDTATDDLRDCCMQATAPMISV